mmetsp:Transcript_25257/g.52856  ORF Transcript_25257/g.52856 Transcript_25257/m.52856 type:complete len:512 (-) Transcript_25257:310-1845(-)
MTSVDNPSTANTMNSPTFQSSASRAAITNEHLALVGFAARLGTTMTNDTSNSDEDAKSVRDEAMLLMSLLTGRKAEEISEEDVGVTAECSSASKNPAASVSEAILGIEKAMEASTTPPATASASTRPQARDMGNFSFSFPLLSLQPDINHGEQLQIGEYCQGRNDDDEDLPPPSQLLGRMRSIHDKEAIRKSSDTMARNVLESFGAALVWRAKTWIQSLCRVLALKDRCKTEEKENSDREEDDIYNEIMSSREMQIIDAIVRSSEEVSVVNIKTSFRVLPDRIDDSDSGTDDSNRLQESREPDSKRLKSDPNEYKVKHKLIFEATVSMTCNDGGERYRTVKLQAPGEIEGTFITSVPSSEEDILSGVSITLDTAALALCLERQSRLVVRRAAEASILASSGIEPDSSHQVQHPVISPRYVLMSPMQPNHHLYASDHEVEERRSSMSTSTLSQGFDGIVSSSDMYSSDSSAITATSTGPKRVTPTSNQSFPPGSPLPALLEVASAEFHNPEH